MEVATKTDNVLKGALEPVRHSLQPHKDEAGLPGAANDIRTSPSEQQQQQQQQKTKRKHRRGKPKAKNSNKAYKKWKWKFQVPRPNYPIKYHNGANGGGSNGGNGNGGGGGRSRAKLLRSRSLVPYNTNKFLMEEHMAEVPSALLTPTGRTRDSSFSMDSEDNYFFSLPEDEEEFLTKEFANVYEKARVERLENLTKQQLIEECLQIEDRYSKDQGTQRQQQLNVQRISSEYMAKIRMLEEKVRELSRENHNLRCQLMRSAALAAAAAASPPSAAAPIGAACQPTPMDSSSEDSESDSTSSSSSSSSSSNIGERGGLVAEIVRPRRPPSISPRSSPSEYNAYDENNYIGNEGQNNANNDDACEDIQRNDDINYEHQRLLEAHMEDDEEHEGGHGGGGGGGGGKMLPNGIHSEEIQHETPAENIGFEDSLDPVLRNHGRSSLSPSPS